MLQWIDRSDAGKLALTGPDAYGCLQALLSADLAPLPVGGGSATALLAPRGQVRALARVLRAERGWLLQCERAALEGLFRGLWSGRVGWQVTLHKLTLQQALVTLVGEPRELAALVPAALAEADEHAHAPLTVVGVPARAVRSWAGVDLIVRADRLTRLTAALAHAGATPLDATDWEALRIDAGRIAYGIDASERSLPAELGLGEAAVATGKGLYPGLQTVLRQQRSGTVHRCLCRLRADHALLAAGDELLRDDAPAGTVTSALAFDGLALVRAGADPLVHGPTGTAVRATPLHDALPSL
jgi:folate-binding Fe-S cluster repair protein YgfZ